MNHLSCMPCPANLMLTLLAVTGAVSALHIRRAERYEQAAAAGAKEGL